MTEPVRPSAAAEPLWEFRPTRRLRIATATALWVFAAAVLVSVGSDIADWRLATDVLNGVEIPETRLRSRDRQRDAVRVTFPAVYALTATLFLAMLYAFARNAKVLAVRKRTAPPAGSVLWFFVPVAHFFMPYLTVQQIWKASDPADARDGPPSALVKRWWALWLLTSVLSLACARLTAEADTADRYRSAVTLNFVVEGIVLALTAVAYLMLQRLAAMQDEKYAKLLARVGQNCPACGEPFAGTVSECPVYGVTPRPRRPSSAERQPPGFGS